jgi:hypothetical protein
MWDRRHFSLVRIFLFPAKHWVTPGYFLTPKDNPIFRYLKATQHQWPEWDQSNALSPYQILPPRHRGDPQVSVEKTGMNFPVGKIVIVL